jgi:Do/DeqQ family serine protease
LQSFVTILYFAEKLKPNLSLNSMSMKKHWPIFLSSFLSAILAVALYRFLLGSPVFSDADQNNYAYPRQVMRRQLLENAQQSSAAAPTEFTLAAELSTPAVVNIQCFEEENALGKIRDFFGETESGGASGSGVIISTDGLIVTNHHVVSEGSKITVSLSNHRELEATLIGSDPSTDIALIKVNASDLPYLSFGNSDSVRVGEWVLAVGNPFDLESTVTAGIVSAKGRSIDVLEAADKIESFIQTDAAVNPGNSGGALVNTRGELVGINTAILTESGQYEGYSFAVPSNLVSKIIYDLENFGIVQRGLLGVRIQSVDQDLASKLGLPNVEGVHITGVTPGSGASEAGLKRGDVILRVNGVKTVTMPELQEQIGRYSPGNTLKIEYFRNHKRQNTRVTLKNNRNGTLAVSASDRAFLQDLGFEVSEISDLELSRLKIDNGVRVIHVEAGSKVDRTHLKPDFIIQNVNKRRVYSEHTLIKILRETKGEVKIEGVYVGTQQPYLYVFQLP